MALSHNALGNMLAYLTNALERDSIVASLEQTTFNLQISYIVAKCYTASKNIFLQIGYC